MTDDRQSPRERGAGPADEEARIERLLEAAGRRPELAAEELAAIKARFRTDWEEHLGRRRRAWTAAVTLAASVLLAIGVAWWWQRALPGSEGPRVGEVAAISGAVRLEVSVGERLPAGAVLETDSGRVAVALLGGPTVRLDAESRMRLVSPHTVELEHGAVYVDDGGGMSPETGFTVRTAMGTVRNRATQFEVRLLEDGRALRVRVREGRVSLDQEGAYAVATAGQEVTLRAGGALARRSVGRFGPEWAWLLEVSPPYSIEGRTLEEFLAWVSRETGWTVRYEDADLEAAAEEIVLHGTLGELSPAAAPEAVLPGAGLEHRLHDGVLVVERGGEGR